MPRPAGAWATMPTVRAAYQAAAGQVDGGDGTGLGGTAPRPPADPVPWLLTIASGDTGSRGGLRRPASARSSPSVTGPHTRPALVGSVRVLACSDVRGGAGIRRAELVALLSLGTDLGLGQPLEHMIRACLIALRLADSVVLDGFRARRRVLAGLLPWVGCHTDAYEQAKWLGDDLTVKRDAHYGYDFGRPGPAAFLLRNVGGTGLPILQRARAGARFLGDGRRALAALAEPGH
jgi:hypothetical protein